MNTLNHKLKHLIVLLFSIGFLESFAHAKGLDELSEDHPDTVKPPEPKKDEPKKEDVKAEEVKKDEPKKEDVKTETSEEQKKEPPAEPAKNYHMFIETGVYKVQAKTSAGTWKTSGMSDVTFGYDPQLLNSEKMTLPFVLKYDAISASATIDSRQYRAILQGYSIGVFPSYILDSSWTLKGIAGLGMYRIAYHAADHLTEDGLTTETKTFFDLGLQCDYGVVESFKIGPKLVASFGGVSKVQYGVSFHFDF